MATYTKEEMLESIKCKNGYQGGEAWEAAHEFMTDYDWDSEWESFDPQEAMKDAFVSGIQWALSHLK